VDEAIALFKNCKAPAFPWKVQQGITLEGLPTMLPTITDTAINALSEAATQIQAALADHGEHHEVEEINLILSHWLESSIESLCNDALYHCVTGDRTFAVNRVEFHKLLDRKRILLEREAATAQERNDQFALAAERVA
jgi:hypothetical protein